MKKRLSISLRQLGVFVAALFGVGVLAWCVAWFVFPFPKDEFLRYDASQCITDRNGEILRTTLNSDGQRCLPIRLEDAGEWLPKAMIATEDKRFSRHHGVDFLALIRAVGQMIQHREVVSGASTISTQTVRLVHPRPRHLGSKIIEAFRAVQMETFLTKEEILEQYLNRSPFGGNLVGIRAASLHYFSKEPADLSLEEASLLAGLPQSPNRLRPDRHPERAKERREMVLQAMRKQNFVEESQFASANKANIHLQLWKPPFLAPHFVDAVLQERFPKKIVQSSQSHAPKYYGRGTSLDLSIQKMAEAQLSWHPNDKAKSAAIIVLDAKTQQILALVGSPDYDDSEIAGQYNVALASRSPGSALKPFVYGLAMDRGLLTPEEILEDQPLQLKGYQPKNFDHSFRRKVSTHTALVESLNLPAIQVLQRVGVQTTLDVLHELGLKTLNKPADHYGLNLVLGGGEVQPLALARAYCKLANPSPANPISPEAAWMVNKILSGNERNHAALGQEVNGSYPKVAWKTGTSARNRDAWTVAWNHQYVVCVWRGNPDGSSCPEMTGLKDAAPLALEIFANLPYVESLPRKPEWPLMLEKRKVCAATGLPKSNHCSQTIFDQFIPGISHNHLCKGQCREKAKAGESASKATRILRPIHGETFALLPSQKQPTLPLEAEGDREVYWFVNGTFFAKANPNKVLQLPLHPGTFEITCTTESGQADRARIFVE